MTNRQIVVVVVLAGLAVCCACLFVGGLLVLIEPTETPATERPTETAATLPTTGPTPTVAPAAIPTNIPTPESTPTVRPTNTPIVVDSERYVSCVTPLLDESVVVIDEIVASSAVGETNPLGFCDDWYPRGLVERAKQIRGAHLLCPAPTDPCVLEGRDYIDLAFSGLADAAIYMTRYCDGSDPLDATNINLAVTAMQETTLYSTLATQQLSTCN